MRRSLFTLAMYLAVVTAAHAPLLRPQESRSQTVSNPVSPAAPAATQATVRATPQQISDAVRRLGETSFQAREEASSFLLAVGAAAEPELTRALDSPDTEVRTRANQLLADIRMGFGPLIPRAVMSLVRQFRNGNSSQRDQIIPLLGEQGPAGVDALLRLAKVETNNGRRNAMFRAILNKGNQKIIEAVRAGNMDIAERILDLGRDSDDFARLRPWLAFQFVSGRADAHIAEMEKVTTPDYRTARQLVLLNRIGGNLPRAIHEARSIADRSWRLALYLDQGDWKAAAEAFAADGTRSNLGRQAAILAWHFAGEPAQCNALLKDLPMQAAPPVPVGPTPRVSAGRTPSIPMWRLPKPALLLLTDRMDEAIKLLVETNNQTVAFDVLCAMGRFTEASTLVPPLDASTPARNIQLQLAYAGQLARLGETEQAFAILDQLGALQAKQPSSMLTLALISAEREIGRPEKALDRAAAVIDSVLTNTSEVLNCLHPGNQGVVWWDLLDALDKKQAKGERLRQIDALLRHKVPAAELDTLVENIRSHVAENGFRNQRRLSIYGREILGALTAAGYQGTWLSDLPPQPARIMIRVPAETDDAPRPAPLRPLDEIRAIAARGQWEEAAARYGALARNSDLSAEFLQGYCLVRLGSKAEGEKLMHEADLCMLAEEPLRTRVADELAALGAAEESARQRRIVTALVDPGANFNVTAASLDAAALEEDPRRGVKLWEQRLIGLMYSGRSLADPQGNPGETGACLRYAAGYHRLRARAALAEGQTDAALAEARAALAILPTDREVAVELVPLLEKAGNKAAADALVTSLVDAHEQILRAYPRAAACHASLSRLFAATSRRLDLALEHARKAVSLLPDNPDVQDALAEVHFARGEFTEAIALEKKLSAAWPDVPVYAAQLARFQAATQPAAKTQPK